MYSIVRRVVCKTYFCENSYMAATDMDSSSAALHDVEQHPWARADDAAALFVYDDNQKTLN